MRLQPLCRTLSIVAASLDDPGSLCSNRCLEYGSAFFLRPVWILDGQSHYPILSALKISEIERKMVREEGETDDVVVLHAFRASTRERRDLEGGRHVVTWWASEWSSPISAARVVLLISGMLDTKPVEMSPTHSVWCGNTADSPPSERKEVCVYWLTDPKPFYSRRHT